MASSLLSTAILWVAYAGLGLGVRLAARALRREVPAGPWFLFLLLPVVFLASGFLQDRTPIPLDHVRAHFPPWNSGPHPLPHNPSFNDVATQFAPWAKAVRIAWKEGSLPFWNRWNGCGMPLAANGQSQAFSPFTCLMFALPLGRAFVLLGASKLLLALIGMWLWLQELGVSASAARFGAVAFAFSFAMTPWLYHPATAEICLWPWVFFAFELLADPAVQRRAFLLLVLLLVSWPLCGHLETATLGALFGALWLGLRTLASDLPRRRAICLAGSLAAFLALGLSAFLLWPQIHAVLASNRLVLANDPSHLSYVPWVPYKPGWLGGFVTSLFPRAFGDLIESPMIPGAAGSIVEMGFGYFGVLGWSCALLVLRPGRRRSPKEWILLTIILLGLFGAMGLPPFRYFFEALPGIRLAPPLRLLLFASAAGAPLAALELDRLTRDLAESQRGLGFFLLVLMTIATLAIAEFAIHRGAHAAAGGLPFQFSALVWTLAVLALAGVLTLLLGRKIIAASLFLPLLTAVSAIELLHQGMRLYRSYSPADLYPETPLIRFLRTRPRPFRIVSDESALYPDTNIFASVESVLTHDPAERRDYVQLLDLSAGYPTFDYFKRIERFEARIFDFTNARFLVTSAQGRGPGGRWIRVYRGEDGQVFENPNALPRFYAPRRIEIVSPSPGAPATERNASPAFGQRLEEFLASGAFADRALVLASPSFPFGAGIRDNPRARIGSVEEKTNRVRFSVSVDGSEKSILVSSLVTDGGWSAEDERGDRLAVGLTNGPFLAIAAPSGEHLVTLTYRPPGFRPAAAISLVSLATLAVLIVSRRRNRRGLTS